MPFTVLVLLGALVAGYVRGGRLQRIPDAGIRLSGALFLGLALQVGSDIAADKGLVPQSVSTALIGVSFGLVGVWIGANRYRPGLPLVALGLAANAAVTILNGGMPVDPDAIAAADLPAREALHGKHTMLTGSTRLAFLADIIPLRPLRTVVSVGDIILAAGLIPFVHHLMTYRSPAERRGGTRRSVAGTSA